VGAVTPCHTPHQLFLPKSLFELYCSSCLTSYTIVCPPLVNTSCLQQHSTPQAWCSLISQTPKRCLMTTSLIAESAFVRASALCSFVQTLFTRIYPNSMHSLMKWNLISMCLLRPWNIGFYIRVIAELLSTNKVTIIGFLPVSSLNNVVNHNGYLLPLLLP
jgi:hypothetical protein